MHAWSLDHVPLALNMGAATAFPDTSLRISSSVHSYDWRQYPRNGHLMTDDRENATKYVGRLGLSARFVDFGGLVLGGTAFVLNWPASEEISAWTFIPCGGYHDSYEVFSNRVISLRRSIMQEITITVNKGSGVK